MAFFLLLAAHAGLWGLAISLQRLVPTGSRAGDVAAAGILHAVVASFLALALGICGGLTPVAMTLAGVGAGALGFGLGGVKAIRGAWEGLVAIVRGIREESAGAGLLLAGIVPPTVEELREAIVWREVFAPCAGMRP